MEETQSLGWCILELMGHRRVAGLVSETVIAGGPMLRVVMPWAGELSQQIYAAAALYCITPTTEGRCKEVMGVREPALLAEAIAADPPCTQWSPAGVEPAEAGQEEDLEDLPLEDICPLEDLPLEDLCPW